jgi:hypothetical protein
MTTKHRLRAVALLALLLCLAFPVAALAGTPSCPDVSTAGAVGTCYKGSVAVVTFSARATGPAQSMPGMSGMMQPAQGSLLLTSRSGVTFCVSVQHIMAHSATDVHFGGPIVKSSDPSLVGRFAHCAAVDNGKCGDAFSVNVTDTGACACAPAMTVLFGQLCARGVDMAPASV